MRALPSGSRDDLTGRSRAWLGHKRARHHSSNRKRREALYRIANGRITRLRRFATESQQRNGEIAMKKLTLAFTLCAAFLLTACGGGDKSDAKPTTAKTETTTTTAETGVPACDEYLAKVDKLMNNPNLPQASKDAYKQSLEQNRTAWKQAAASPQGKAGMESGCKIALDSIRSMPDQ